MIIDLEANPSPRRVRKLLSVRRTLADWPVLARLDVGAVGDRLGSVGTTGGSVGFVAKAG